MKKPKRYSVAISYEARVLLAGIASIKGVSLQEAADLAIIEARKGMSYNLPKVFSSYEEKRRKEC